MPIPISWIIGWRERKTLTLAVERDGEVIEDEVTLYHKPLDDEMWAELKAIEEQPEAGMPILTRQLLALDIRGTFSRDDRRLHLSAAVLAEMGLPAQRAMAQAIVATRDRGQLYAEQPIKEG